MTTSNIIRDHRDWHTTQVRNRNAFDAHLWNDLCDIEEYLAAGDNDLRFNRNDALIREWAQGWLDAATRFGAVVSWSAFGSDHVSVAWQYLADLVNRRNHRDVEVFHATELIRRTVVVGRHQ